MFRGRRGERFTFTECNPHLTPRQPPHLVSPPPPPKPLAEARRSGCLPRAVDFLHNFGIDDGLLCSPPKVRQPALVRPTQLMHTHLQIVQPTLLPPSMGRGGQHAQKASAGDQTQDRPDFRCEYDHTPAIGCHGRVHYRYNGRVNLRGTIAALAAIALLLTLWPLSASQGQSPPASGTGEISLRVAQFGLSGFARPGDWVGIELKVTDSAAQPRNVLLRIHIPDSDGDSALMKRVIVANPGVEQSAWLYAHLPFNVDAGTTFKITAHEAIDSGNGVPGEDGTQYIPGRMLASLAYPMGNPALSTQGMIGVVGSNSAGLDQYQANFISTGGFAPTGHELTKIVSGLAPGLAPGRSIGTLPDRWHGLAAFEAIVWTGASSQEQPLTLTAPQADAIREWVERGGHFIAIIPPAGQSWVDVPGNPLSSIMPEVALQRNDGVDLNTYRQLLSRRSDVALPNNVVMHSFTPRSGTERYTAIPILNGPDGKAVVVRRLVGTGAVTLIGFDLTTRQIADVSGALHADLFWHRVLGKRLPLLSPADLNSETRPTAVGTNTPPPPKWIGGRADADLDGPIGPAITRSAKAAAGLLLAFVVFLLYWLLAGPVGFYALKERNLKHYSWLGFVVAAGIFTAIAWGGANVLRGRRIEGQHLTFVDHVYGQSNQRIRSWFTLLLPTYGTQRIAIGEAADTDRWKHALTSWEPFTSTGGSGLASFPDARPYEVDARSPWRLDVPARATTKTFRADWAGGLPANWGMITPRSADGASVGLGEELQLTRDPDVFNRWRISGKLTHGLPSALEDVTVIVVVGQDTLPLPRNSRIMYSDGRLQARAWDFAAPANKPWLPGEELDLAVVTGSDGSASRMEITRLLDRIVPKPPSMGGQSPMLLAERNVVESLMALSLFSILNPPEPNQSGTQTLARRSAAHTLDLARWFTQPCIIVIGHLSADAQGNGIESPLPVSVDGAPSDTTRKRILGRTVIRWVYPLPPAPPGFAVAPPDFNSPAGAPVPADPSDALDTPAPDTNP